MFSSSAWQLMLGKQWSSREKINIVSRNGRVLMPCIVFGAMYFILVSPDTWSSSRKENTPTPSYQEDEPSRIDDNVKEMKARLKRLKYQCQKIRNDLNNNSLG